MLNSTPMFFDCVLLTRFGKDLLAFIGKNVFFIENLFSGSIDDRSSETEADAACVCKALRVGEFLYGQNLFC